MIDFSGDKIRHRKRDGTAQVNGSLLAFYRAQRGWTQEQLAHLAGYSERLIRKAEAGRSVKRATLEDLAEAVSTPDVPISAEDLATDQLSLITKFRESYAFGERQAASLIQEVVSEDFQFWAAGDEEELACAGHFDGLAGFDTYLKELFALYERVDKDAYTKGTVFFQGKDFIFDTHDGGHMHGVDEKIWLRLLVAGRIEHGRIVEMRSTFDGVEFTKFTLAHMEKHQRPSDTEQS